MKSDELQIFIALILTSIVFLTILYIIYKIVKKAKEKIDDVIKKKKEKLDDVIKKKQDAISNFKDSILFWGAAILVVGSVILVILNLCQGIRPDPRAESDIDWSDGGGGYP